VAVSRQSSLFDFEQDSPQAIVERVQERAREAVDSREVVVNG